MVPLETELAETTAGHTRLVDISARAEAGGNKEQAGLEVLKIRPGEVEQEGKLASASLGQARKQFAKLVKIAGKASCPLT